MKDYKAYLKSPQWQAIRKRVLKRDRYRCRSCGKQAWQVHHGSYGRATMEGSDLSQLFAICGDCHHIATFTITGAKRTAEERHEMAAALAEEKKRQAEKRHQNKKRRNRHGKVRMDIGAIRALSQKYAEGRMS